MHKLQTGNLISNEDLYPIVINILKSQLKLQRDISTNENLLVVGLDSKRASILVYNLEKKYKIFFSDEELMLSNFSNIQNIVSILQKKMVGE